ncbi:DUF6707 family protein [Sinomonas atrocyanea]|uniref:DUF6707 family protein n=1 Tax=Sinomonas atrocyanea TaxID=37927 RepID=UPI00277E1D68|nr:DUF6707 family protein [Sinomonas atrocyanea]MDQ0260873.1 hypothetical protein [Sinomonas atrocyanea]MDR6622172.1 hypothetical protein [Sinomonas atrocyanea]
MHHSSGPHERPGTPEFHEIDAHELKHGQRLLLPDGEGSAEVLEVDTVLDDYGHPALYFAVLDNDLNLRVAHGTRVRVARGKGGRPADLLFAGAGRDSAGSAGAGDSAAPAASAAPDAGGTGAYRTDSAPARTETEVLVSTEPHATEPPAAGASPAAVPQAPLRGPSEITLETGDVVVVPGAAPAAASSLRPDLLARIPALDEKPEELMRAIDAAHPGRHAVNELAGRLAKGINVKSGACLADLRELAFELYVGQDDTGNALKVADLLAVLPYDGNPARWASIESALGLAAHLARKEGDEERAEAYGELLRTPDTAETDPFRARMAERVRQRALNAPNLYDKEVTRAAASKDHAEERAWRMLRLGSLLHLRAHGGSTVFTQEELDRRIDVELGAVRP